MYSPNRDSTFGEEAFGEDVFGEDDEQQDESDAGNSVSSSPPKIAELHISSFGPTLFDLDIQHSESAPRRQAACFGLGFQGYKLPEDETASKVTVTQASMHGQSGIHHVRGSSEKLVNDFGFLGEAVI